MPIITVIIPAYNQSHYLAGAIESVLAQDYEDWECIVVNDGSTDSTAEVVKAYQDQRIHYIYQQNAGLSAARNTGIRNARGKYLSFLDSDDLFAKNKLSLLINVFHNNPEIALVSGSTELIDQNGIAIARKFDPVLPADTSQLLLGNPLHVGSVLVKRSWQEKIGFFDTRLRSYEDWDFWLRLALYNAKFVCIPEVVSFYRFHTEQMTRNRQQMTRASFTVLDQIYAQQNLPEPWIQLKDKAYSHSHLRAAANAYAGSDFNNGKNHLRQAILLSPDLAEEGSTNLAKRMVAWTELPKIQQPVAFLESIEKNLPEEFSVGFRKQFNKALSQKTLEIAFQNYRQNNFKQARKLIISSIRRTPTWLFNRGVLSVLFHSCFPLTKNLTTNNQERQT
ncbi:MAG: hypothetical protein CVU39_17855 [Chloroflexi bacterium HGW-Chloroflexi-10]|nr:MAG: hypothetical protein CVU39_17855 [Chloroflexi bacterium HGW-Chloroflexi-10]